MEKVLDRKEVVTRGRRYLKFLVKWTGLPYEDSSWILKEELRSLSSDGKAKTRKERFAGGPAIF